MKVLVTFWDVEGGENSQVLGTYDSLQITYNVLRDGKDQLLAEYHSKCGHDNDDHWFVFANESEWTDFTVEAVEE